MENLFAYFATANSDILKLLSAKYGILLGVLAIVYKWILKEIQMFSSSI